MVEGRPQRTVGMDCGDHAPSEGTAQFAPSQLATVYSAKPS